MKTQWLQICENLQNRLNPGTYKVWVAPLTAELEGDRINLTAPNGFVATWVRDRLLNDIADAAGEDQAAGAAQQAAQGGDAQSNDNNNGGANGGSDNNGFVDAQFTEE